jgi:fructokinase
VTDQTRVLCLGEALVDFVSEQPVDRLTEASSFVPLFGGSQANIAVGAARFGASAALAGCAGTDAWGLWLREALEREGVDVSRFRLRPDVQTQHAFVAISPEGEPEFSFFGGVQGGCMPALDELAALVSESECGVLVFGSDTLIAERDRRTVAGLKRLALDAGWLILFDPNLRASRWRDETTMREVALRAIEGVTVVKANEREAVSLTGRSDPEEAAHGLLALGARSALVTASREGAILAPAAGPAERVPAVAARAVDATGAGDAVAAVVAAALARGGELTSAVVRLAMEVAARVVAERGALVGLPDADEARSLLDPHVPG